MGMELAVTVVATVIVLALIAYGVLTGRKDRGGLPGVRVWRSDYVPITLTLSMEDEGILHEHFASSLREATLWWNGAAGLELFSPFGELTLAGTIVPVLAASMEDEEEHENALAFTRLVLDKDGSIKSAAVYCTSQLSGVSKEKLLRAICHELGHVLGLDHDDGMMASVMHPKAVVDGFALTAGDAEILQLAYGRDDVEV